MERGFGFSSLWVTFDILVLVFIVPEEASLVWDQFLGRKSSS